MLNPHRSAAPQVGGCARVSTRLAHTDFERAPVVFGWLLYAQDRFAGAVHLETLYRLDRVGGSAGQSNPSLQPSVYYGQSTEMLAALMRVQQHTRLPQAPPGCRWLGPQLITEVSVTSTQPQPPAPPPVPLDALPAGRSARLAFARAIARRLLHRPEGA